MNDSDSALSTPYSPVFANPSPESPRITPSSAQPPPHDRDALTSSFLLPITASNGSFSNSNGSLGMPDSLAPPSEKLHYQSSSFSNHSPSSPAPQQLKYSVSSPVLPSQIGHAEDSSLTGKYRPRTRSPSDGSDIRWYFCKTPLGPNEAAASVPLTELVGKGEYFRFSKSDSDALEAAFLEREEELVRAWWKEYAETREGPSSGTSSSGADPAEAASESKTKDLQSSRSLQKRALDEEENVGVVVKGGLYEVDLLHRRCTPVYWQGEHRRVLRGHWFARKGGLDWLPLREDISEQLEIAYESQIWRRRRFQPSGLYAARVNLHGATQGLHALFTGEDDSWEAWLCVDMSGISFVLGLKGLGVKLRRGFTLPESPQPTQDEIRQMKEEEMDDYASKVPVRHVVFMVHGIGQRLEKANLVDDVGTFRRTVATLAEQHLTQYQRDCQRVLFIPCQWRRGLKLGGESAVEDCTLDGVRALRTMLSATVHDVLYYMSPVYCQDIIDSVSRSLNRLYGKFIKRNPNYNGKVSLYGHSLGSVLSYDILCHQTVGSLTSTAPIAEVRPDENSESFEEDSSPVDGVETEDHMSDQAVVAYSPPDGVIDVHSEGEGSGEVETSGRDRDLEHDGHDGELVEKDLGKDPEVEIMEVEALRQEVKRLQDKLSALKPEKCANADISSSPIHGAYSGGLGATFGVSTNFEGLNRRGSDDNDRATSEESFISRSEDRTGDKGENLLDGKGSSKKHFTPFICYTKLDFEVDTFYAVGSPLGVFLSLRNIRIGEGRGQEYWQDDAIEEEMPAVRQMMNIFHPYDPVAYRIEPLICKEFVKMRPTFIPYHKGGKRLHIGMQEFQEDLSARSKAIVNSLSSVGNRVASAFSAGTAEQDECKENERDKEKTYGALMMERLTGSSQGRLDYQLQDATFEHQYISVLSSHTAYWHDLDTALFILKHLYRDIPEKPPEPSNEEAELKVLYEDSEVPDFVNPEEAAEVILLREDSDPDEVSLTFSSKDEIAAVLADANNIKS